MRYDRRGLIAALLAFLYPGLGHLYLRAWLRAFAWFGLALVTAAIVVPESAFQAFENQGFEGLLAASKSFGLEVTLSLLVVRLLNIADAYLTAIRQAGPTSAAGAGVNDAAHCPACGKEVDESIDFCPWCTTRFEEFDGEESATSR